MKKKKSKKFFQGVISAILMMIIIVMILSFVFSLFGMESYKTYISNGVLESSLVTVNNIFSHEGFKYLFTNIVSNFKLFEPLVLLIISLIGVGIADASGMLDCIFLPLRKIKGVFLTFIIILVSVSITFFGSSSYVILFPLVGLLYKKIGKNPVLGILTVFLGVTLGYGTGIMFNYDSYVLGALTEAAATVDVDKDYVFSLVSTEYIMVFSTFIISFVLANIIDKKIAPLYYKRAEVLPSENKFNYPTLFLFLGLLLILVYMIIPGLPGSGLLLDMSSVRYIDKLFGANSPFANGFICIFSLFLIICGLFYGRMKGIKSSEVYTEGLSNTFNGYGYLFVLMFLASLLQGIIDWTNIGVVLSCKMIDFISNMQLSGVFLIIVFFFVIVLMSIFIPSTIDKWIIASPVAVPLMMRSNITPDFTQFIYQIADSVGKSLTPVYAYFLIFIGFMFKFKDDEYPITVSNTLKLTIPVGLVMGLLWLLILALWYISGLPIGIGGFSTL
jgi:aminobenzoyl-glutamate transport protein